MSALPPLAADGRGRTLVQLAGFALAQAGCAGAAAFATRDIFAALASGGAMPTTALLILGASGFAVAGLRVAERVLAERVGQAYAAALRLKLFRHISHLPPRDVAERRFGALALRFVGDLQAVRGWIARGFARLVSAAIVIPLTTLVLFLLDPVLGAAAAGPLLLGLIVMAALGPRLAPAHRRLRTSRARLAADMSERLPHGPELRLLGRLEIECGRLAQRTDALVGAAVDRALRFAMLQTIPDIMAATAAAALLLVAWRTGASTAEAAGALAALGLLTHPLRGLADAWDRHRAWIVAREKCQNILQIRPVRRPSATAASADQRPARLELIDVDLGGRAFSVSARPGEKVAVIGPNGAGKSSLLTIAAGLDRPARGRVMLGNADVAGLARRERQTRIAFAGPRSPILKGSLRRALTMGAGQVPDDVTIRRQAIAGGLGAVLERLGGLEGTVAEGGRNLSSGEARRILLTRALLSDSELLLLDEPDDALDPTASAGVVDLLRAQPATALVVTHDLGLARRLDTLWFVVDHAVVTTGAPADLLREGSPVAQFFGSGRAA